MLSLGSLQVSVQLLKEMTTVKNNKNIHLIEYRGRKG